MRVGILGIQHESNTFLAKPTELEDFERVHLLSGAAIEEAYAASHHELAGFFAGLKETGLEAVPLLMAWAWPGGRISAACAAELVRRATDSLTAAGTLDGLLVAPHGAGVAEGEPDFDGYWLQTVRSIVGTRMPIVSTLDLHCNLSPKMVAAVDAMFPYRTNPHLDQKETGLRAARLLARTLRGEVRPVQRGAFPPVAINIERQDTSRFPCRLLYERSEEIRTRPGVLEAGILLGFPYADVAEMGSSFVVCTDDQPDLAQSLADELADLLVSRRLDFAGQFVSIEEALNRAYESRGPVCLLDMGDNVGGGSPGDGTWLLQAAYRENRPDLFVCLYDPPAAAAAADRGQGHWLTLEMGGKTDARHGEPLTAQAFVEGLHSGKFRETEARHGGRVEYDMGPTATVRTDRGQTVMLISSRIAPFTLQQLLSCGVEPRRFRAIVAKGVHAPVAAYAPVCQEMIRVDTPGVTRADMRALAFQRRRTPLFPFEDDEIFDSPRRR